MADRTHSHDTSTPAMSAETVPSEEFVLVPREPTPEMIEAAIARELGAPNLRRALAIRSYHAMIAAAPVLSASHLAKEGGEAGAVEAVAAALWREEASQGTPKSVWQARTIEAFRDTSSANQERWNRFARAALASLPQPSLALAKGGDAMREALEREGRESYEIGKRDGYEEAVQHIDQRTGGDGEYCCVVGYDADDRHCPDPQSMIARIVERFEALSTPTEGPASQTEGMGGDAPAWIANCCQCQRIVDTREQEAGGDPHGCELSDGRWTCSFECWDAAVGDGPNPTPVDLAALTPPETAEAVPVAWRWRMAADRVWNYQEDRQRIPDAIHEALYARPAPATDDRQRLVDALRPFANAVFNDNGDMTVSPVTDYDAYVDAYFARRAALATEASR